MLRELLSKIYLTNSKTAGKRSANTSVLRAFTVLALLLFAQTNDVLHELEHLQVVEHTQVCEGMLAIGLDAIAPIASSIFFSSILLTESELLRPAAKRSVSPAFFQVRAPPVA